MVFDSRLCQTASCVPVALGASPRTLRGPPCQGKPWTPRRDSSLCSSFPISLLLLLPNHPFHAQAPLVTTQVPIKETPPCLMSMHRGGLCLAPAIQIHPVHGPMCALHLFHERRSQAARPTFQVRVDAQDLEALDRLAEIHNLTRSDAFRRLLRHLPFPRTKIDADTYFELRKIGVNINQMTRAINRGDDPEIRHIQDCLEDLDARLDSIALRLCQEPGRRDDS